MSSGTGLAAVSMVKNEADIIELFIRINSRIFDRIYILDHNSDDNTLLILESLKAEGYSIEIIPLSGESQAYSQVEITSRYVNSIGMSGEHAFIMPLDADEFLHVPRLAELADYLDAFIPHQGLAKVPWKTYCPTHTSFKNSDGPLFRYFKSRNYEPGCYFKVILSRQLASFCKLEMGNHDISSPGNTSFVQPPFIVQHVPVRSSAQIASKACIGSMAQALNASRKPGQGSHWDQISKLAVSRGLRLGYRDTLAIALNYSCWQRHPWYRFWLRPRLEWRSRSPRIGRSLDNIRYVEYSRIDVLENIHNFVDNLCPRELDIVRKGCPHILNYIRL